MDYSNCMISIVSCIAEVVLAVCAIVALVQLRISKEQLQRQKEEFSVNSHRDAIKAAIEQIHYYSIEIIPSYNDLCKKIKEKDITFFDENSLIMENGKIDTTNLSVKELDIEKIKTVLTEFGDVSNKMENFAICITSGVADQEFAFNALSDVFCSEVERFLPFYAMLQEKDSNSSEDFPATLLLYQKWKDRIKLKKLQQEQRKIEEELQKIMKK